MNDRSSGTGIVIAFATVLVLLCMAVVGGGLMFVMFARRSAEMREAQAQSRSSEMRAIESIDAAQPRRIAESQQRAAAGELSPQKAIENVLLSQAEAWNHGDLDKFMEHYWKSDDLTFSSGGKITRGWTATLARYRERYSTSEKMGKLQFENLEITLLGDDAALVLGRWQLDRSTEPVSGNFSLVLRKLDGKWLIVHDHTSSLEAATSP